LKAAFTELGADFEAAHPGSTVAFSFAGSSDLVAQLQQGAPADVFASADTRTMDKATADGLVTGEPVIFAANALQIAVPPGNPAEIATFADLARPGVNVVVCAPEVPCGAATKRLEASTRVSLSPVSEESSVADVLGKVIAGEADAGLVYVTDVMAAGDRVTGVSVPPAAAAATTYPIAILKGSENAALAGKFVDLVSGPEGQSVLKAAGFAGSAGP
jgi:molybdate transport system substrate-binding protein